MARVTPTPVGGVPWARNGETAGAATRSVPVGARSATNAGEAVVGVGAAVVDGPAPACEDELVPHAPLRRPITATRTRAMVRLRMAVVLSHEAGRAHRCLEAVSLNELGFASR